MKKKKIVVTELKLKSFVTQFGVNNKNTVRGGGGKFTDKNVCGSLGCPTGGDTTYEGGDSNNSCYCSIDSCAYTCHGPNCPGWPN